ncbi:hypothetical protein PIB30_110364, partial [Stylosanthes scabra]|nr:hypothetical protein [Stylosanthes scabra]
MEVLSMFQRSRSVALEYEKLGTYGTGLILPTQPFDKVWLRGLRDNHPYLGLVVFMGTHNIWIQDQAPFYQFYLNLSLLLSILNTHTIATPNFLTTEVGPCVNSLGERLESRAR